MNNDLTELKSQILKKNLMLEAAMRGDSPDTEDIHRMRYELDNLLFKYCKSLKHI